jgi:hypothetical protein
VQQVRTRHPGLDVRVVDLDEEPGYHLPTGVVGTPTWLLDGRPRWSGNPSLAELGRVLAVEDAAGEPHPGDTGSSRRAAVAATLSSLHGTGTRSRT